MKPKLVFMGTPDFALPSLATLINGDFRITGVICQPDRPRGRHSSPAEPPVKKMAVQHGIKVLQPVNLKSPEFMNELAQMAPDLIVTAAYGRILPPEVLALPEYGCLNVHASLLPAYRGAAPVNWALIKGEEQTGVTIMLMDEGLDTGDILTQKTIPVSQEDDAGRLTDVLAQLGAEMLPRVIRSWLDGEIEPVPQNEDDASYAPMMKRETGEIDWAASSLEIHNLIRGTYPWPGAYTWCEGRRLKIHKAKINNQPELLETVRSCEPGTICLCGATSISVACGSGAIDLLEIQTESGRRMHCRDCAHNYRFGQKMGGNRK